MRQKLPGKRAIITADRLLKKKKKLKSNKMNEAEGDRAGSEAGCHSLPVPFAGSAHHTVTILCATGL